MLHSFYHEASPWSLHVGKQWQWNDKMTWTFFFILLKIVWHMESPSTCSFSPKCGTYKSRNLPTFVWKFQSAFSDIHTDFHLTQLYRKSLHLELSLIQLKTNSVMGQIPFIVSAFQFSPYTADTFPKSTQGNSLSSHIPSQQTPQLHNYLLVTKPKGQLPSFTRHCSSTWLLLTPFLKLSFLNLQGHHLHLVSFFYSPP